MATEKTIKGKRCRYYKDSYIYVSADGTVVAVKQKSGSWKYFDIKTDGNSEKYVDTGYKVVYIKKQCSLASVIVTTLRKPKFGTRMVTPPI